MSLHVLPRPTAPTILIVDDTPANLVVMVDYLHSHGFSVVVAQDGQEAIERALYVRPDLILLDVMMPGINGFDTCQRLKQAPETADIPVIFMTALSESVDKLRGFDAGGVDYITKPFQLEEVLARINTHLALQEMQRQLGAQNLALQQEAAVRREAEAALQRAHGELEERVARRTAELAQANASLTREMIERGRMQDAVLEREARIRRLIESNIIGIFFWSSQGDITEANDAFLQITGYTHQDIQAHRVSWSRMTPPDHGGADQRALAELARSGTCTPYEKEFISKDGRRIPILVGAAFFDGSRETGVGFVLDLTERKQAEQRIRFMAHHDALTGLANRALLQDRLVQAIAGAQRAATQLALLVIDLDDFKRINDSLGHDVGDQLLQMVANRFKASLRKGDSIARLGGDEFVITVAPLLDASDAALVARKTLDALQHPFIAGGQQFHVSASIGISLYPADGNDMDALMRAGDTAMYHAKDSGRANYEFFTPELNQALHRRLLMENRLRQALADDQFTLHYQPQIDMTNGRIYSSEALLRWELAGQETSSCGDCIATAEKTGLIVPIGEWTLRQACKQLKRWHALGHAQLRVAVNLSPRQFYQPKLPDIVAGILEETGIAPRFLDLEITEGILLQRNSENIAALKELSAMGIQLSVDDFGTGYSSLAYLQRYPINSLKIDRSFVGAIPQDASARALVNAIIAMARSLGLSILAEGVETPQQASFLMENGCTHAQGYYYSAAVAPDRFTTLLAGAH